MWWLPDALDNKVSGTLFFNRNEIKLEIMGAFRDEVGFQELFAEPKAPFEIVHGQSGHGEEFTLFKANYSFDGGMKSYTGFKSEVYRVSSFIVGGHFPDSTNIAFHSCTIYPTYLTAWLDKSPITMELIRNSKDYNIETATANYKNIDTFSYKVGVLEAEIEECYRANFTLDNFRENLHWKFASGIKVVASNDRDMEWFNDRGVELKNLFSILIGEGVYFKNIYFLGELKDSDSLEKGIRDRKGYAYFITQRDYRDKEKFTNRDILINFDDVKEQLGGLLNNWFKKSENLKEIYKLYFGILYSEVVHIESSLLKTIQILEIYHRNKYNGMVFSVDKFNLEKKKLKGLSKRNLAKEVHVKMMESIGRSNEFSLKMRLAELINDFSGETQKELIGDENDVKKFIKQLVDTRNYLAHYDADRKPNLLTTIDEKFYGIQRLKALVTLILFVELGMSEEFVMKKIKSSKHFSYSIAKAKELLND
ncbi:HEPN domain-containing protein [Planococcus halocryophilus]|uniref:ApeA N-terminal domain 1-containing protein n=1 Tax=Planococcus halocryophilus TaxID=1215089 RepID=UPI0022A90408|nr:HEPN domain-containing protein [Planococcus halocryophilus]